MKTHIFSFFKYFLLVVFFFGCSKDDRNEWQLAPDEFVFVDHHMLSHGVLIEGDCFPYIAIGSPDYFFNQETRTLYGHVFFPIDEDLKAVQGTGITLSGVIGTGEGKSLFGAYSFPTEKIYDLYIEEIYLDGTVHLVYKDSSIFLGQNEKWVKVWDEIQTHVMGGDTVKALVTHTDSIVNYGILRKSAIVPD